MRLTIIRRKMYWQDSGDWSRNTVPRHCGVDVSWFVIRCYFPALPLHENTIQDNYSKHRKSFESKAGA